MFFGCQLWPEGYRTVQKNSTLCNGNWYISGVMMRKSLIFEINFQHQGSQLSCLISTVPRKFGFFVALYVNVKMPFTRGRPLRQQMMELRAVHALPRPPTLPRSKIICEMESSWIVLSILYKQYFWGGFWYPSSLFPNYLSDSLCDLGRWYCKDF